MTWNKGENKIWNMFLQTKICIFLEFYIRNAAAEFVFVLQELEWNCFLHFSKVHFYTVAIFESDKNPQYGQRAFPFLIFFLFLCIFITILIPMCQLPCILKRGKNFQNIWQIKGLNTLSYKNGLYKNERGIFDGHHWEINATTNCMCNAAMHLARYKFVTKVLISILCVLTRLVSHSCLI